MHWETVDIRARVTNGCYYITLAHDPAGDAYIARYCPDPRPSGHEPAFGGVDWGFHRIRGIGHDTDIEKVKLMCESDARNNGLF